VWVPKLEAGKKKKKNWVCIGESYEDISHFIWRKYSVNLYCTADHQISPFKNNFVIQFHILKSLLDKQRKYFLAFPKSRLNALQLRVTAKMFITKNCNHRLSNVCCVSILTITNNNIEFMTNNDGYGWLFFFRLLCWKVTKNIDWKFKRLESFHVW